MVGVCTAPQASRARFSAADTVVLARRAFEDLREERQRVAGTYEGFPERCSLDDRAGRG
jgi:hypothetical protein